MSSTLKARRKQPPTNGHQKEPDANPSTAQAHPPPQRRPSSWLPRIVHRYLLDGLGGTIDGSFFRAPTWVDLSRPPGTTSQWEMNLGTPHIPALLTGQAIVYSPNLVWLLIAAGIYVLAPYDLTSMTSDGNSDSLDYHHQQQQHSLQWFLKRAGLNVTIMLLYYGFWHTTLYGLGWASRPFAQGRVYRWSKLCHNVWYCVLGCVQWTAWETIMVHLYSTGRIGYQRDEEIVNSIIGRNIQNWKGLLNFCGCIILVPFFREVHFFFAHRFIHMRCLYKYIHGLHHRNTDIEPFAGLCMSPAEHLYYISSIAPSVYWHASPFQFLWNGVHLILSPAASHSGWEDHWQSDQFHAAHHRYFECNYGK